MASAASTPHRVFRRVRWLPSTNGHPSSVPVRLPRARSSFTTATSSSSTSRSGCSVSPTSRGTKTRSSTTLKRCCDGWVGVVHRLDKDTSGLIVFARTAHAKRALAAQFREHTIDRVYHAIAHGAVTATRVETHLVLDRGDGMRGSYGHFRRPKRGVPIEAKRSVTHIRPIAGLVGATLVECRLETGRQHQIRIHLSELGHPLVGERVYIRDYVGLKIEAIRPMLHARTLGFAHPRTAERFSFQREPPDDFQATIESLRTAR